MSGEEHSRRGILLDRLRERPTQSFRLLTGLILVAIVAVFAVRAVEAEDDPVLPIEFRLEKKKLSGLPVRIDEIQSCSCWFGPRDQAQRKYKFRVVNNTDRVVDIGGGTGSAIRLIVAYPNHKKPRLTMPTPTSDMIPHRFGSPPDINIPVSDEIARVRASEIKDTNAFFGVPEGYSVWALPPSPNKLAELIDGGEGSYPTVVDKTHLLPGEEYSGDRLGHGTWTFYIPLPHRFAKLFEPAVEPILPRRVYERHVIFIGVAAFRRESDDIADLLGFAPAPSDDALAFPSEL